MITGGEDGGIGRGGGRGGGGRAGGGEGGELSDHSAKFLEMCHGCSCSLWGTSVSQ